MILTRKRTTLLALSIVLAAVLTISATWAYFTDTDDAENVFTVGSGIDVGIDEPNWDPDPNPEDPDDDGDGQDVAPGNVFTKDPKVTMNEGQGYVRLIMEIKDMSDNLITNDARLAAILGTMVYDSTFDGTVDSGAITEADKLTSSEIAALARYNTANWEQKSASGGRYVYWYKNADGNLMEQGDAAYFFTHVMFPTDWDTEEIELVDPDGTGYKIVFSVQAIQDDGFADATAAFGALETQLDANETPVEP